MRLCPTANPEPIPVKACPGCVGCSARRVSTETTLARTRCATFEKSRAPSQDAAQCVEVSDVTTFEVDVPHCIESNEHARVAQLKNAGDFVLQRQAGSFAVLNMKSPASRVV
jgi:hypothetical protein